MQLQYLSEAGWGHSECWATGLAASHELWYFLRRDSWEHSLYQEREKQIDVHTECLKMQRPLLWEILDIYFSCYSWNGISPSSLSWKNPLTFFMQPSSSLHIGRGLSTSGTSAEQARTCSAVPGERSEPQLPFPRNKQHLGVACTSVLVILPYSRLSGTPSLAPVPNTDSNRKMD